MHLANLTTAWFKRNSVLLFTLFIYSFSSAQDNSPYSRYGLGDILSGQNISTRAMGGIGAGYSSYLDMNLKNPAALGAIQKTVFDVGGEVGIRTLKSTGAADKYTSANTTISYLQFGFPIASKKMKKKDKPISWGLSFGIRPITRIAYKIEKNERLPGIDSLNTLYEGSGGVNQMNVTTGFKITTSHNQAYPANTGFFSVGISSGYSFGNKDFSTQKVFINDTVAYYKSNTQTESHFGGVFLNSGIQYHIPLAKNSFIQLGGYANFQQNLKAKQDKVNETFSYDATLGIFPIDSVSSIKDQKGSVIMPATYGIGLTYQDKNEHWLVGADFEWSNWKNFSYYGAQDAVQNSWLIRAGAQYFPGKKNTPSMSYWNVVKYKVGFYLGPDYVKLDETRLNYAGTLGAGFPLTREILLNTAVEIGGRGSNSSFSFKENTLRFGIGLSMGADWFIKRSYY
jgi:hypothetical protein